MSDGTTLGGRIARFAATLDYDAIPEETRVAARRYLADTLACAIAAAAEREAPALDSILRYARSVGSAQEATLIGYGGQLGLREAALVNCTLARYLDANDIYLGLPGRFAGGGHFSDAIPAVVGAAEALGSSGQDLLTAVVLAYEVQGALANAYLWLDRGFHSVSQVAVGTAAAVGWLLKLDETRLLHAISLSITGGLILQSWLKPAPVVPAIKGGAAGISAERGILCARLAAEGFTGPPDAIETLFEYFPAEALPEMFDALGTGWTTPRNAIKLAPAQIFTQPVIQCAQDLHRQGLRLDNLQRLTVHSNNGACGRVQGSPGAFKPESRESADHSTPFVVAMTLRDGAVTAASYDGEPWRDPELGEKMSSMELMIDPYWDAEFEAGRFGAEIVATDSSGRRYQTRVEQFAGHPDNTPTDEELLAKLSGLLDRELVQGPGAGRRLLEACQQIDAAPSVVDLVELLTLRGDHSSA